MIRRVNCSMNYFLFEPNFLLYKGELHHAAELWVFLILFNLSLCLNIFFFALVPYEWNYSWEKSCTSVVQLFLFSRDILEQLSLVFEIKNLENQCLFKELSLQKFSFVIEISWWNFNSVCEIIQWKSLFLVGG